MSYMSHSEGCTCTECVVMRNERPPAPVAQPVHEQQTLEIAGAAPPVVVWNSEAAPGVRIREAVDLPQGVDWRSLEIVGAARLAVDGEIVALLARFTWGARCLLAIWWDRNERRLRAHGVDELPAR